MTRKKLVAAVFFAFVLWACGASEPERGGAAAAADPGQQIFRKHCVLCHGAKGDLKLNGAKDLGESQLSLEERVLIITKGRNVMTPFERVLSAEEIEAVARYTFTFSDTSHVD